MRLVFLNFLNMLIRQTPLWGLLMVCLSLTACSQHTPNLEIATEYPEPHEEEDARQLLQFLQAQMERDYPTGTMPRPVHAKHHGCLKAKFTVESNLPQSMKVGVFQESRSYDAWIRFSNNGTGDAPDYEEDIRGMAIKLMGIEGEKLLQQEKHETTQDFLLINSTAFPAKNIKNFHQLLVAVEEGSPAWYFLNPFDAHFKELRILLNARKIYGNLLDVHYWSGTPYLFGQNQAVKYSAKPCSPLVTSMPENPDQNYLRETMVMQLLQENACFEFNVQFQKNPYTMLIEDATSEWDTDESPLQKIATIHIPPQTFDSQKQMEFCENLSFTPWHSLPEHRPLGNLNRGRKTIYEGSSKFRHQKNQTPRQEPTGNETF